MLTTWCSEMGPKQGTISCFPLHAAAQGPAFSSSQKKKRRSEDAASGWAVAAKERISLHCKHSKKRGLLAQEKSQDIPGVIPEACRLR